MELLIVLFVIVIVFVFVLSSSKVDHFGTDTLSDNIKTKIASAFTGIGDKIANLFKVGFDPVIPDKTPCPSDMTDRDGSCWKDAIGRGFGRIPNKRPCPPGTDDIGTDCWLNTKTKPLKGYVPHVRCDGGQKQGVGTASWCDNGPRADFWNLKTWDSIKYCDDGDEIIDGLCQQKCQAYRAATPATPATTFKLFGINVPVPAQPAQPEVRGYHNAGCCLCEPDGGPRIQLSLSDRQYCNDDEDKVGALCYPKCPPNYRSVGTNLCEPNDGPGGIRIWPTSRYKCPPASKPTHTKLTGALCYANI